MTVAKDLGLPSVCCRREFTASASGLLPDAKPHVFALALRGASQYHDVSLILS